MNSSHPLRHKKRETKFSCLVTDGKSHKVSTFTRLQLGAGAARQQPSGLTPARRLRWKSRSLLQVSAENPPELGKAIVLPAVFAPRQLVTSVCFHLLLSLQALAKFAFLSRKEKGTCCKKRVIPQMRSNMGEERVLSIP